jgi:hypothetical protein
MKPKNILIGLVALFVAIALYMFTPVDLPLKNEPEAQNTPNDTSKDGKVQDMPNALEGELKVSTDKRRGNLMLLMNDSDRIIYLNTSRDFSTLIGKQVSVTIEGSLDDFRLVDIKAK